ncbi:hypothetical protein PFUM301598_17140 [Pseudomonas fluorescens]
MLKAINQERKLMAAMFFQGSLGSALTYSVFQGSVARPGPQGQPPGSWCGGAPHASADKNFQANDSAGTFARAPGAPVAPQLDATKTTAQVRNH